MKRPVRNARSIRRARDGRRQAPPGAAQHCGQPDVSRDIRVRACVVCFDHHPFRLVFHRRRSLPLCVSLLQAIFALGP